MRGCLLLADACAGDDTDSAVQQRREQVMKAAMGLSLDVAPSRSRIFFEIDSLILTQHAHTVNPPYSSLPYICPRILAPGESEKHPDSSPDLRPFSAMSLVCSPSSLKLQKLGKTFRRALRHPIGRSHQLRSSVLH